MRWKMQPESTEPVTLITSNPARPPTNRPSGHVEKYEMTSVIITSKPYFSSDEVSSPKRYRPKGTDGGLNHISWHQHGETGETANHRLTGREGRISTMDYACHPCFNVNFG